MLRNRHLSHVVQSDGGDACKQVISVAASEVRNLSQTGRAEQKVRHLREFQQVLVEDARARGIEFLLENLTA